MPNREREGIGPSVVTGLQNISEEGIVCAQCNKSLARLDISTDTCSPSCEELAKQGCIAVPNFGWFCGQECAKAYEAEFNVRFQRNSDGRIDYYADS